MDEPRIGVIGYKSKQTRIWIRPPIEHLQAFWERGTFYELRLLEYIQKWHRGGTFIDVGSSIGNHTLFFLAHCNPDLVVSIEPARASLEHQKANLSLNDFEDKVLLLYLALGNSSGWAKMEKFGSNLGQYSISEGHEVQVLTLDSVVRERKIRGITLLKIDVEGYELEVLEGSEETLKKEHPSVFVEVFRSGNHPKIWSLLEALGYSRGRRWSNMFEFKYP